MASVGAVAMAVVLALGTAGCGLQRSGYQFVRSPQTGTYLKVPDDWKVYSKADIKRYLAKNSPESSVDDFRFISTFDGSEHPSIGFDPSGDAPVGVVRVRPVKPDERDEVSFFSLRNELFDLQGGDGSQVTPVSAEDVQYGGVRGQRIVFTRTELFGAAATLDQTTLVDKTTNTVYLLVVGCRPDCYQRNKKQIDTVVTSLTIKER